MYLNQDVMPNMQDKAETGRSGSKLLDKTGRADVRARCIVLILAMVAVLVLMVLVFAGFVVTSLLGLPLWPSWNNYSFFVLFEVCMSLAFGALIQGLILIWPRRVRKPERGSG